MAKNYEVTDTLITLEAAEAINAGALIEINSDGKAVNATQNIGSGVSYEEASAGEQVAVEIDKAVIMVKVNAAATAITAGDLLKWDATNKVFVKADLTAGDTAVAIALEGATADGVYISSFVNLTYEPVIAAVVVNAAATAIAAGDLLKWDATNAVYVKAAAGDTATAKALAAASTDGATINAVVGFQTTV